MSQRPTSICEAAANGGGYGRRLEPNVVVLAAECEVAMWATVHSLRAALVATIVAADSAAVPPHSSPIRCFGHSTGQAAVYRRPFVLLGLAGACDALALDRGTIGQEPVKVLKAHETSRSNTEPRACGQCGPEAVGTSPSALDTGLTYERPMSFPADDPARPVFADWLHTPTR